MLSRALRSPEPFDIAIALLTAAAEADPDASTAQASTSPVNVSANDPPTLQ
jgi:hypothetical protein